LRLVTVHDLNFFYFKSPGKIRRYVHRTRRLLQRYGQVAAISRYVEQDIRQQLNYAGGSRVIYNGARNLNGCPEAAAPGLEDRAYFLHLSRMVRSKNIEAILGLAKVWPEKLFVLAGSRNPESLQHQEHARQEGLANVRFLMDIGEELKTWLYHHCEAFLFPSLTEGFGLPPIEAMHFGKPVFLSDRTCLPEIGGDRAFYWHDFEPKSMRLVVEEGLRRYREEELGPGIQAHAARYSWKACTNDYLALYLSLLGIPGKERR
jgi:glycosyltransferase involved in cell wall biosynthesis